MRTSPLSLIWCGHWLHHCPPPCRPRTCCPSFSAPAWSLLTHYSRTFQVKRLVQKAKVKQRAVAAAVRSGEASAKQPSHAAAPSGRSGEPAEPAMPGHVKRKLKKKAQFLDSACCLPRDAPSAASLSGPSDYSLLSSLLMVTTMTCRAQDGSRGSPSSPARHHYVEHLQGEPFVRRSSC